MAVLVYEQRVQRLKNQDFNPKYFQSVVLNWLFDRPPLLPTNIHFPFIQAMILGEIEEVRQEAELLGTENFNNSDANSEWGDIGWFIYGLVALNRLPLDDTNIRSKLNGYGGRSDVYDVMSEVAGNMSEKSLVNDLEHLIPIWISVIASFPEYVNPDLIIQSIFHKNETNYASEAFVGNIERDNQGNLCVRNPFTGKIMSDEELTLAYDIPKRALRMIRDFQIDILGRKDRKNGLKEDDFSPYLPDILHFLKFTKDLDQAKNIGENALNALYTRLHLDNNIQLGTLKRR